MPVLGSQRLEGEDQPISAKLRRHIADHFDQVRLGMQLIDTAAVATVAECILELRRRGGSAYIFGNGGSASTASHFATDANRALSTSGRMQPPIFCLSDNVSTLTALANDFDFTDVFVRQLRNLGRRGDLVIALSTRGKSRNLVRAFEYAASSEITSIAFVGFDGGDLMGLVNHVVHIPIDDVRAIEDLQLSVMHSISRSLEGM